VKLEEALRLPRIAVAGPPRTGKTTLAQRIAAKSGSRLISTDAFMALGWEAQPDAIASAVHGLNRFVVEGIQVGRALRKGLLDVDVVLWLDVPRVALSDRQRATTKGCGKIFRDWLESNAGRIPVVVP
jgi:adenylate kinase family enzyme